MSTYNPNEPISDEEIFELDEFLVSKKATKATMPIDMLDGFLTAIFVGPITILPSQWLPLVWDISGNGEEPEFDSIEEGQYIASLIVRFYQRNAILLQDTDYYLPLLDLFEVDDTDEDRAFAMTLWASGFMYGIDIIKDNWDLLFTNVDALKTLIAPIAMLSFQLKDHINVEPELRNEFWEMVPDCVYGIKNYWKNGVLKNVPTVNASSRVASSKIQRNAPCPCGSGKKYKHCCGK